MKKVLFIVGSLREESLNRQLAKRAAAHIEARGGTASLLEYKDIPLMNQDLEYPVPEAVARIRKEVTDADGLWIVTPEYNHSYSGVIKNVIDWLSRPQDPLDRKSPNVLTGKKTVISGAAGRDAAIDARQNMESLANAVGLNVIEGAGMGVVLGKEAFVSDELKLTAEEEADLDNLAGALLAQI